MVSDAVTLQLKTLRAYGWLLANAEARALLWPGKVVLAAGAGVSTTGIAAAACLAGATALVVDSDAAAVRSMYRDGGVDFVVNSLDEALRILKNEVRKGTPVGVALAGDVAGVVAEMRERGVTPDLTWSAEDDAAEYRQWLESRGWNESELENEMPEFAPDDPRARWMRGIARYQRSAAREKRWVWL